ncbi:MAG: hypothetical protein LN414_04840 [Candidatus Thermoplasmatota archaeon]|nr:hypothetical protein [Candidatus Thermoplasmatota archaeon]
MAFKLFKKRRRRHHDAEPIEMGPVPEDEDSGFQLEPGQPVPYEVSSWLPGRGKDGEVGSIYQRGSADLSLPDKVILDERLRSREDEKVHTVKVPPVDPVNQMTHECLNCGYPFKVPYRRPVTVACPDCGAEDQLR